MSLCSTLCATFVAEAQPRFHLLTNELTRRIGAHDTALISALESVGRYTRKDGRTGGTAYLLDVPHPDGRACMLTAHHVALHEKQSVLGDRVTFYVGGASSLQVDANIIAVRAADAEIDYALLEVTLPPALRHLIGVRYAESGHTPLIEGTRLFNPSFPRIWPDEKAVVGQRLVSGPTSRRLYRAALAGESTPKMLQVGRAEGWQIEGFEVASLPQQNGSSGSPVFDTNTHRFVGMLTAGGGLDSAMIRPAKTIFDDIARRLNTTR